MMKALTVKPLLWVIAALVVVIAGMAVERTITSARHKASIAGITIERDKLKSLAEQRSLRIDELDSANATNTTTINELGRQLVVEVGKNQNTASALKAAEAARTAANRDRDRAQDALARQRETIYATDASCADWGHRPVCGALSEQLQQLWDQARQVPADPD